MNWPERPPAHYRRVVAEARVAFVMEQNLGHITHFQNLRAVVSRQTAVKPTWIPIPFGPGGLGRLVPGYAGNWSLRAGYRARRRLARELGARQHDAIFFHTQVTALFSRALMRSVPAVVSLDATPINYDSVGAAYGHRAAGGSWLDHRKFAINREVFHTALRLVAWSEWARDSLVADYGVPGDRITVIPPGASDSYLTLGDERMKGGREPDTERPVRLLFVGNDFERKGGPLLLESIRAIRTRRRFEVHVVTARAIPETRDVIVYHGVTPNSDSLRQLFRDADIFVLPSLGECLAIALMEAAAAGLPVVATNVGAMAEAAMPGRTALVVSPGDGTALRAALETLIDNEPFRISLGREGHVLARQRFDAEKNGNRLLELIVEATRASATRRVA